MTDRHLRALAKLDSVTASGKTILEVTELLWLYSNTAMTVAVQIENLKYLVALEDLILMGIYH